MTGRRAGWPARNIPPLDGRVAIVTGANSGLGSHVARILAGRGAFVVLACRDADRARPVATRIQAAGGRAVVATVDLSDLSSVRAFAAGIAARQPVVDILVNNGGVMALPRMLTVDGFEQQLAVNHLGHFALTGLLMTQLRAAAGRVVTVSSFVAGGGRIRFEDLQSERSYDPWAAYAQSKLANLLFAGELARRVQGRGGLCSVAAHPGYSATSLVANGPGTYATGLRRMAMLAGHRLPAQGAFTGSLPAVMAAAGDGVSNGDYWAPRGPLHLRGLPTRIRLPSRATDAASASELWALSERLTGVRYELP